MTAFESAEVPANPLVLGHRALYMLPKSVRMVEFRQVAQFVDDNVVGDFGRQEYDFVIEI